MELKAYWEILKRKWRIVLPVFLVTFIASIGFTLAQPRVYEAKATYVARLTPSFEENKDFATALDILSRRVEIATTYAELAKSRRIKILAAQSLGLSPGSTNNLSVIGRLIAGTNIIEIIVQGSDPILVRDFTNAVGASTLDYVRDLYETYELAPVDMAITPRTPIRPKTTLSFVLGGVFGLVLGMSFAFLSHYLQTSREFPRDVSDEGDEIMASNQYSPSPKQLWEDLIALQAQFEATRHELEQTRVVLRRTRYYAGDIEPDLNSLNASLEDNHTDLDQDDRQSYGTSQ